MSKLFQILIAAILACTAHAQTVVQSKAVEPGGAAAQSFTASFDSSVTAGSHVIVMIGYAYGGTHGAPVVTDSASRVFTRATGASANGGFANLFDVHAFYYENHPGGITQITVTQQGGLNDISAARAFLVEVSGLASTSSLDGASAQVQAPAATTTDAISSGSITTTANNDFVVGMTYNDDGGGSLSAGTGWTSGAGDTVSQKIRGEYRTLVSAGSIAATFTHSAVGDHLTNVVAFKSSGGGGTPVPVFLHHYQQMR